MALRMGQAAEVEPVCRTSVDSTAPSFGWNCASYYRIPLANSSNLLNRSPNTGGKGLLGSLSREQIANSEFANGILQEGIASAVVQTTRSQNQSKHR
jgi:hypothetical protein